MITLGINLAFIPAFGYTAAAWATFACYGSMMIASWALGNKHFTVDYDLKRILGYLALSVALYLAGCLIPEDAGFWGLAGKNALFLLFISMVLFLEKNGIRSLARSLKK